VLTVLVLLLLGIALGHWRLLPEGTSAVLDAVVVRLAVPGLVLAVVPELPLGPEIAVPVGAAWGTVALLAGLVWVWGRLAGWDPTTLGTMLVVVPLANTSFLGFPAVEALLGADHLPHAVVYDQVGSFLALTVYGSVLAGHYGAGSVPSVGQLGMRVLRFPPFVALLVGLAAIPFGLPAPVADVAGHLGAMVTPLAMVAVGLKLRLARDGWRPGLLAAGLGLRLVVAPAAVLAVALLVGGEGPAWSVAVLESAMPPMVLAAVLASSAGLDGELASRLTAVGVLASMATLPLWALLVG
jgi:malate permease and related proteins